MFYFWKKIPFFRLIIPFVAGILVQYYHPFSLQVLLVVGGIGVVMAGLFHVLPRRLQFSKQWVQGLMLHVVLLSVGAATVWQKDITNNPEWLGHYNTNDTLPVLATLTEPLVEKTKSYKAIVNVDAVLVGEKWKPATGKVLLYFSKDSSGKPLLDYGSRVLFNKPLQAIKNSGNPGCFDYQQFNAFKDIYHQLFLKTPEYRVLPGINANPFQQWLYGLQTKVLSILETNIPDEKEASVAEALLIGYRDNLDKDLVQAYSKTGVVHVIAISGLHLAMIYGVLIMLFKPFRNRRWVTVVRPVTVLLVLWIFTLLAGAAPSILRSAVMFSFIVAGEIISKKTSIYNTLAASAFVLLCSNPFFLWDIGFQLSYTAVLSIVIFSKPIAQWISIDNKFLDNIWQMISATLAAQILTVPIIFYSFHQFPNLFLLTNCLVVPLSSLVLYSELLLVAFSCWPAAAKVIGIATGFLLWCMNAYIEQMSNISFAIFDGIQVSAAEAYLLYGFITTAAVWLFYKSKWALRLAIISAIIYCGLWAQDIISEKHQNKIVVYNIPRQTGVDMIAGNSYAFVGDSILREDGYLRNFHLKPSRILYQANQEQALPSVAVSLPFVTFHHYRLMVIDKPYRFSAPQKIAVNTIVITKNANIDIPAIANTFTFDRLVFDGSNSTYKVNDWRKVCDSMRIAYHDCAVNGAFEADL